ncbi:hypothetical protein DT076_16525 [Desertihabitans brevis]|uniref:Uncharacterized protein n=1 Tax=Desertihabitans brevis TaxID=2268447 RepID=A0A367YQZ6_9ACTN|nr:hypothetical protein [Desertihabitans brevis]RCK68254.1 hypothetical protein DT076_16525 [Desertihabitans brevis]
MNREPLFTVGGITAAVAAVLALLVAFGVPLTDDQQKAILGVVAALGPLAVALITRRYTAAWATVLEQQAKDGTKVAGPANPLVAEGEEIPDLDDPHTANPWAGTPRTVPPELGGDAVAYEVETYEPEPDPEPAGERYLDTDNDGTPDVR